MELAPSSPCFLSLHYCVRYYYFDYFHIIAYTFCTPYSYQSITVSCVGNLQLCVLLTVAYLSVSTVDIREIKEIRSGQKSRDFDRYVEDSAARLDQAHCFVILYGTEFRLKSLSLAGMHRERGLTHWQEVACYHCTSIRPLVSLINQIFTLCLLLGFLYF